MNIIQGWTGHSGIWPMPGGQKPMSQNMGRSHWLKN